MEHQLYVVQTILRKCNTGINKDKKCATEIMIKKCEQNLLSRLLQSQRFYKIIIYDLKAGDTENDILLVFFFVFKAHWTSIHKVKIRFK